MLSSASLKCWYCLSKSNKSVIESEIKFRREKRGPWNGGRGGVEEGWHSSNASAGLEKETFLAQFALRSPVDLIMGNQPVTQRTRKAPGSLVKYRPSPQATQAQVMGYHSCCRLYRRVTYESIPIQRVDVNVQILQNMAQIMVKQVYLNTTPSPMECTYVNPLFCKSRSSPPPLLTVFCSSPTPNRFANAGIPSK